MRIQTIVHPFTSHIRRIRHHTVIPPRQIPQLPEAAAHLGHRLVGKEIRVSSGVQIRQQILNLPLHLCRYRDEGSKVGRLSDSQTPPAAADSL